MDWKKRETQAIMQHATCPNDYCCQGQIIIVKEYIGEGPKEQNLGECPICKGDYHMVHCALCRDIKDNPDELDFHHWDYENDTGVLLCPDCHKYIHRGLKASEQGRQHGDGGNWQKDAINRLVERHLEYEDNISAKELLERYNVPEKLLPERLLNKI